MAKDLLEGGGRKGKGSVVMASSVKTGKSMKSAGAMMPKRKVRGKR
ncbi:MAG TPA: hypothetical protein VI728_09385 [Syntrophales bacterium]|nr:hypothetical protein [Syntrophales bacterium]